MEEAPENGKESSHSAHASGMNEQIAARGEGLIYHSFYDALFLV
jgi:hypothetical protein